MFITKENNTMNDGIYEAFGGKNNKWVRMGSGGGMYLRSDNIYVQRAKGGWKVYFHSAWKSTHKTLKEAKRHGETWASMELINSKADKLGLLKF